MNKRIWALAWALPVLAIAAAASPDQVFYKEAAEGGIAEVQLGQLAQQKAQSAAVKEFGRMMVTDHTTVGERLQTVAAARQMGLPTAPSPTQQDAIAHLQDLSGAPFDRAYIQEMLQEHKDDIRVFDTEAREGKDSAARRFAQRTLPLLRRHLRRIESVARTEGLSKE